jgi:hypothetical protein
MVLCRAIHATWQAPAHPPPHPVHAGGLRVVVAANSFALSCGSGRWRGLRRGFAGRRRPRLREERRLHLVRADETTRSPASGLMACAKAVVIDRGKTGGREQQASGRARRFRARKAGPGRLRGRRVGAPWRGCGTGGVPARPGGGADHAGTFGRPRDGARGRAAVPRRHGGYGPGRPDVPGWFSAVAAAVRRAEGPSRLTGINLAAARSRPAGNRMKIDQ